MISSCAFSGKRIDEEELAVSLSRLSSVLVDYHNNVLDLLEKELNHDGNSHVRALKNLVNDLTSKDVSILQIARDSTGVITLNEKDIRWIEKLARSSLVNNEEGYRHTAETRFEFDLVHVQSYVIRTHLLLCRINYRHIAQKYQCRVRATRTAASNETVELGENYLERLRQQQLDTDWNHLKQTPLDALHQATQLLRQIALMLKNNNDEDQSRMPLSDFIRTVAADSDLLKQWEQCKIKDFLLCYIDHVRELYDESISDFRHLFTDVSHLLRTSLDRESDAAVFNMLQATLIDVDYADDVDKIKSTIQTITDLLNQLRAIEDTLLQQSTRSLSETCQYVDVVSPILALIPDDLKCEHYVPFSIHLIRTRAILQERAVNIEEKETKRWQANFDQIPKESKQENRYHGYLNANDSTSGSEITEGNLNSDDWELVPMTVDDSQTTRNQSFLFDDDDDDDLPDRKRSPTTTTATRGIPFDRQRIDYVALFEFDVKWTPLTSSSLFDQIHQTRQSPATPSEVITRAQKFVVTYPDGKSQSYLLKSERLFDKLRSIFHEKNYDLNALAVVDKDAILVDFTNDATRRTHAVSLEYSIIDRANLLLVQFSFHEQSFECRATSDARIRHVIDRFIEQRNEQGTSPTRCLCFFNSYGRTIDAVTIGELVNTTPHKEKTIAITVVEEDAEKNSLCQITLRTKQGTEITTPSLSSTHSSFQVKN